MIIKAIFIIITLTLEPPGTILLELLGSLQSLIGSPSTLGEFHLPRLKVYQKGRWSSQGSDVNFGRGNMSMKGHQDTALAPGQRQIIYVVECLSHKSDEFLCSAGTLYVSIVSKS